MRHRHLAEVLQWQADRLGPGVALRYKRHGLYRDLSWRDYAEQAQACAAALVDAGVAAGDRVGLLSENRVEWLIADMGLLMAGAVNVPPHASRTARQVLYELDDAGVSWLFVSTAEQMTKAREIAPSLSKLRGIIAFDPKAVDYSYLGKRTSEYTWQEVLQRGRHVLPRVQAELQERDRRLDGETLATIMYTSGTTGNPKGVMLTHGNLLSNAEASDQASPRPADGVILNWLPFSHIYARTVDHYLSIVAGVPLALADSVDTLVENLGEIEPTHISSVPRFYEKLLASVASLPEEQRHKRLRAIFGRRIDWLGSGGAPLPLAVAQAFQAAGLLILQGYGLTESSPVISFNRKTHYKLDTVGQAIPGVEIRIADDGEILTRGPHVMKGYWNNPQATAEVIRDGWLYTGDLGALDADGFLTITGRKKEILVLSNGKKVAPNVVEGLLLADPLIDQAVIYGEGKNFLTALIVPHWDKICRTLAEQGEDLPQNPVHELTRHPTVTSLIAGRIRAALADVSPCEQVKHFVLLPRPFSIAEEELTVSLKLRRSVIFAKHQAELDALYKTNRANE
jgi:long-chain acyl-CoA synthetase